MQNQAVQTPAARSSGAKTRILIVDDHPMVRMGLSQLLAEDPNFQIAGEAGDMGSALQRIYADKPDLVLVDISLDSGNGIELIKQIKALDSNIKMLAISMHSDLLYAERALRAGALGYINKQEPPEAIVKAVQQVARGEIHLSEAIAGRLLHRAVNGGKNQTGSTVECLSDRELEVFEMIGAGMATSEIAQKLHLSLKTIETHRENIKAKLSLRNGNELIRTAVQWTMENP